MFADAAGNNAGEMRQIGSDVQADAVERNPMAYPDSDRGNLVFRTARLVGPVHPDADPVLASFAFDIEAFQGPDDPLFEGGYVGAQIGAAMLQIEHDIGDALARPVIGELAATPRSVDREARFDQIAGIGAGARRVDWGMLQEPDMLWAPIANGRYQCIHARHRLIIRDMLCAPFAHDFQG